MLEKGAGPVQKDARRRTYQTGMQQPLFKTQALRLPEATPVVETSQVVVVESCWAAWREPREESCEQSSQDKDHLSGLW